MDYQKKTYLNRSTSFEGFTFSKSNRFNAGSPINPGFYNLSKGLAKQGTVFGTEKRPDLFTRTEIHSPGPSFYNPGFAKDKKGKIAAQSDVGGREKIRVKNHSPGPGSYQIDRNLVGSKYSFQMKYNKKLPDITPCGGDYNPNFSFVARRTYSGIGFGYGTKIDPCKGKIKPGPGDYKMPACFPAMKSGPFYPNTRSESMKLDRFSPKVVSPTGSPTLV